MLLPYSLDVGKLWDLRKILSENIRKNRASLHISQAKLAEYSGISVSHMLDIEYCKTWVSDKTLSQIAQALNLEAYELLIPENDKKEKHGGKNRTVQQTAGLIKTKKMLLRKQIDESMDDLLMEMIKLNGNKADDD